MVEAGKAGKASLYQFLQTCALVRKLETLEKAGVCQLFKFFQLLQRSGHRTSLQKLVNTCFSSFSSFPWQYANVGWLLAPWSLRKVGKAGKARINLFLQTCTLTRKLETLEKLMFTSVSSCSSFRTSADKQYFSNLFNSFWTYGVDNQLIRA